jgi:hypothetical protein
MLFKLLGLWYSVMGSLSRVRQPSRLRSRQLTTWRVRALFLEGSAVGDIVR